MRQTLVLALVLCCFAVQADAKGVHGYFKKSGTYVFPHARTSPDGMKWNNYSTRGNVNPYNGKVGRQPIYNNPPKLGLGTTTNIKNHYVK